MLIIETIDEQFLLILGLAGAKIKNPDSTLRDLRNAFPKAQIQLMRADRIAGKEHLLMAARNAVKAFRQGYQRSQSLGMELLLYTACQRQISKAIDLIGIGPRTGAVALVAVSPDKNTLEKLARTAAEMVRGRPNDDALEIDSNEKVAELKKVYNVTERELEASS